MEFRNTLEFAESLDKKDELSHFRQQFHIPKLNGKDVLYFTGNSLGLQPKSTRGAIEKVLNKWAKEGVEGHFNGDDQWYDYHKANKANLAAIVGAKESEVILMNTLTVNLHLLMVSFYRPSGKRFKILIEAGAFPSDQYAVESQVKFHGYEPEEAIIEVKPKDSSHLLETEDIIQAIEENGESIALVLFAGVQYFTGQFFDLERITQAGHKVGARVGFDLAHAAGNVPLKLHDWGADFATWCSYKYLNGGPGNLAGAFVHERHGNNADLPRFAGWWGHDEEERFQMKKGFIPMPGVDGWQLSNGVILAVAAVNAALELHAEVGMEKLRTKSLQLTGYAEFLVKDIASRFAGIDIITPSDQNERGCQLSIQLSNHGKKVFDHLVEHGVIADWREPNQEAASAGVIRIAPVPLYNTYSDVYHFARILTEGLEKFIN